MKCCLIEYLPSHLMIPTWNIVLLEVNRSINKQKNNKAPGECRSSCSSRIELLINNEEENGVVRTYYGELMKI